MQETLSTLNSEGRAYGKVFILFSALWTRGGQSIKIDIWKLIDKSISIDNLKINVIDFIDQPIEVDTHTLGSFNFIDFIGFIIIYRSCWKESIEIYYLFFSLRF